jgi:hypothetical protein
MIDDALRARWSCASGLVTRRVADARAHAEAGRIDQGLERLDELRVALVGQGSGARAGLLWDARGPFSRQSVALHRQCLEPEIHQNEPRLDPDSEPPGRQANVASRDLHRDTSYLITDAKAGLTAAHLAGGRNGEAHAVRVARFNGWEQTTRVALHRHVQSAFGF